MSQEASVKEFSLPVEFDSHIKEGIGLPPKIVLEFKTQYRKIISIKRAGEAVSLVGRIVPIPASYHDRSVVVLPEKWEKAYNIPSTTVMCKLIEPSFANAIELKQIDTKKSKSLPTITERIEDKKVIFKDQYIRENDIICRIESIDKDTSEAIVTDNTVYKLSDDPDEKQISVGDENREDSVKDTPAVEEREVTFENLHKVKGINDTIKRLINEVVYPFIDIIDGHVSKPDPMGGVLLFGPPGCGKTEIATSIAEDLGVYFDPVKIGDLGV